MITSSTRCISIDWGTSRFRLRVVDRRSAQIYEEVQTDQGIKPMYGSWLVSGTDRVTFYLEYVYDQLKQLDQPTDLPIIISGMASSSIGMVELQYARLPFSCQGQGLKIEKIENVFSMLVYLISGVASADDVMRGEETQLIGVYESPASTGSKVCYIFPGTHSKHIICHQNQVIDFRTYMTGEIFETIKEHTILKQSIEKGTLDQHHENAFLEGVRDTVSDNLLHSLFKIRATQILKTSEKSANNYYLSGLLIGCEMADLKRLGIDSVFLCAQDQLQQLYTLAANKLNISLNSLNKPLQNATIIGQLKILSLITGSQPYE